MESQERCPVDDGAQNDRRATRQLDPRATNLIPFLDKEPFANLPADLNKISYWNLLLSFFPSDWLRLARQSGALKGLRQDKSAEDLLRVLLLHLGCDSMRETVVRARKANLADLSDVALLKRLRKSKDWLFQLYRALFAERGLGSPAPRQRMLPSDPRQHDRWSSPVQRPRW